MDASQEVLPLLADKCFLCHGPDAATREADLRLDRSDEAHASGVLSGESPELLGRIRSSDPNRRMPPPASGLTLTAEEQDVLARWIAEGAAYRTHWAFEPLPEQVDVPAVAAPWPTDTLDHFVRARMREADLEPSPPASPDRWLRRVTYDLTGLPPTLEEQDAFSDDPSPAARVAVVDRLLASPAFGEHMAVHWLDLARYADSYGYQADRLASMWPYRDWVVEAFRSGMPFDRFLTEQIAGDLLPEPTWSQRLATAFNRLHLMTNEGGALDEEWRVEYVADRVNTLGQSVLGLSLECARCHDHKYDPISQRDYYSLFAYFNSIDEAGLYMDDERIPTPSLLLPTPAQRREWERLQETPAEDLDLPALPASQGTGEIGRYPLTHIGPRGRIHNRIDPENRGKAHSGVTVHEDEDGRSLRLNGDDGVVFPGLCNGFPPGQPFTLALWLKIPAELDNGLILHRSTGLGADFFGMELTLQDGRLRFAFKRFWPGNALAVGGASLPKDEWVHVTATNAGTLSAEQMRLYVNGVEESRVLKDNLTKLPGAGIGNLVLGARSADTGLRGALAKDLRVFDRALPPHQIARLQKGPNRRKLIEQARKAPPGLTLSASELARRLAILELQTEFLEIPVMDELPEERPTHLLARGAYDAPRTEANRVERRPPEALMDPADPPAPDRLALARWLTAPDHPLTARVAVNHLWAQFFGRGLVESQDDFGVQGAAPSHPLLIDYLAREFVDSGWDVRALCRRIVLSTTYGQDSAADRERDPENRYLARGPSERLSAEELRDTALAAAGLLVDQVGGPPVSPYQPDGLWRESNQMTNTYEQGSGDDLYRRSLYTVWKRTAPMPNMMVFDHSERETACARREVTNTPLQALVLLNDVQFVEAARVMAELEVAANAAPPQAIDRLFRRMAGRLPTADERAILMDLYQEQLDMFAADPSAAEALSKTGEREPLPGAPNVQVAALTVVAQTIFSSDATVWKR